MRMQLEEAAERVAAADAATAAARAAAATATRDVGVARAECEQSASRARNDSSQSRGKIAHLEAKIIEARTEHESMVRVKTNALTHFTSHIHTHDSCSNSFGCTCIACDCVAA